MEESELEDKTSSFSFSATSAAEVLFYMSSFESVENGSLIVF